MPRKAREAKGAAAPFSVYSDKLKSSGLTSDDASDLGIKLLTPNQTAKLGHAEVLSMHLPYFDASGKATGFYRVRYLEKPAGSFAAATKKGAQRYAQPANAEPQVYLARGVLWPALFKDASMPLHITEGELKSACACKAGFPMMGLGGVWSWKSAKKGTALLPALAAIRWKGRQVYIAFDSDAATNPQVAKAQSELCDVLTDLGASPSVVQLPELEAGKKCGVDDLICSLGEAAYADAAASAQPYAAARELLSLNSEIAYVRDQGIVIVMQDGRRLKPRDFTAHAYANRFYHEQVVDKQGNMRLDQKPLAKAWLEWGQRAELAALTYSPGEELITPRNEFNLWKGWACEPKRGDIQPWRNLLGHLFAGKKAEQEWFESWLAYPIQHPGQKLYSAAVIWGIAKGTGKSLVGYSMKKIYGSNFTEIGEKDLSGNFNEWAQGKQLVMGDDVTSSATRNLVAESIKNMITRQALRINAKFLPSYEVPDCINYYFTSNHPDAFFIEDMERRYFVHEVIAPPREREFYKIYLQWLNNDGGAAALFHHLLHLPIRDFDPQGPALETAAGAAMTMDSKSDLGTWIAHLRESPDFVLKVGDARIQRDLFTSSELLQVYDPAGKGRATANGLGRELKRAGFRYINDGKVIMTKRGPQRLYAIRNAEQWLKAAQQLCAAHYEGSQAKAAEKGKKY